MISNEVVVRVVARGEATAEEVRAAMARTTHGEPTVVESHRIEGGAVTGLVVLANAAIVTLPALLREIRLLLAGRASAGSGPIQSIRISGAGDIEIESPGPGDLDRLIERWSSGSETASP